MPLTKEAIDQQMEIEKAIIEQLTPTFLSKTPSDEKRLARLISIERLDALRKILFGMDVHGYGKAWEEANPPKDSSEQ